MSRGKLSRVKLSGFTRPSKANEPAFARALEAVFEVARELIDSLETTAPPKDRLVEAARAKERNARRFGPPGPLMIAHCQSADSLREGKLPHRFIQLGQSNASMPQSAITQ